MLHGRRPRQRPIDYETRIRVTLHALREIEVTQDGHVGTRDDLQALKNDNDAPDVRGRYMHPSLATLQLYLLDERGYGANYIDNPLANAKAVADSLRRAAFAVGDLPAHEPLASLTRRASKFERGYPLLYGVVRHILLLQMAGLYPTPLSIAEENLVYERLHTLENERLLRRLERALQDWHGKLVSGAEEWTAQQRDTEIQRIMTTVIDDFMRVWQNAQSPPSVISIKQERLDDAFFRG